MCELINAKKRLAFSKIFLDDRYPKDNDVILRIINFFNNIRVRIYNIRNELIDDIYLNKCLTVKYLKDVLSKFMEGYPYRMLYKIDRGNGEFETRRDNHYPDDDLLTNTTGLEIIDLIVIPLAAIVKHHEGGGKRKRRKSKRRSSKRKKSKRRSKRR